jgi:hypothetical protein
MLLSWPGSLGFSADCLSRSLRLEFQEHGSGTLQIAPGRGHCHLPSPARCDYSGARSLALRVPSLARRTSSGSLKRLRGVQPLFWNWNCDRRGSGGKDLAVPIAWEFRVVRAKAGAPLSGAPDGTSADGPICSCPTLPSFLPLPALLRRAACCDSRGRPGAWPWAADFS